MRPYAHIRTERRKLLFLLSVGVFTCLCLALFWQLDTLPTMAAAEPTPLLSVAAPNGLEPTPATANDGLRRFAASRAAHAIAAAAYQPVATVFPVVAYRPYKPLPKSVADAWLRRQKRMNSRVRWYGGRKYVYWKTLHLRVTSYAPDRRCCYPFDGRTTASGKSVTTNGGKLVAADTRVIPFNYLVAVPGYAGGRPVPVLDRGGAIKGYHVDVLLPTFKAARSWGSRHLSVRVYRPAK